MNQTFFRKVSVEWDQPTVTAKEGTVFKRKPYIPYIYKIMSLYETYKI